MTAADMPGQAPERWEFHRAGLRCSTSAGHDIGFLALERFAGAAAGQDL